MVGSNQQQTATAVIFSGLLQRLGEGVEYQHSRRRRRRRLRLLLIYGSGATIENRTVAHNIRPVLV